MRFLTTGLVIATGALLLHTRADLRIDGVSTASKLLERTPGIVARSVDRTVRETISAFAHTGDVLARVLSRHTKNTGASFARAYDHIQETAWRGGYVAAGTLSVVRISSLQAVSCTPRARAVAVMVSTEGASCDSTARRSGFVSVVRATVERVIAPIMRIGRFVGASYVRSGEKRERHREYESSTRISNIDG